MQTFIHEICLKCAVIHVGYEIGCTFPLFGHHGSSIFHGSCPISFTCCFNLGCFTKFGRLINRSFQVARVEKRLKILYNVSKTRPGRNSVSANSKYY